MEPKFGTIKEPNTIYVYFAHDMDESWFDVEFPKNELNGSYDRAESIKKIARKYNWKILYSREDPYGVFKL